MEHKRITPILAGILAMSCLILTVIFVMLNRKITYLPASAVDSLVSVMEQDGIALDKELISTKLSNGTVYVCETENYSQKVAELLGEDRVESVYAIPEGQIITLENGSIFKFEDNFAFVYHRDGVLGEIPNLLDGDYFAEGLNEKTRSEVSAIATKFIDRGSREFKTDEKMSVVTEVERIAEKDGLYYVFCTRTIDGVEITENAVLCVVDGEEVVEAYGTWCFLTLGKSYSAQLSDELNILFNVKKEIAAAKEKDEEVTIIAIEQCYALYFLGESDEFCLIPCKKIVTDSMGEYIYNAIDGALYTKN